MNQYPSGPSVKNNLPGVVPSSDLERNKDQIRGATSNEAPIPSEMIPNVLALNEMHRLKLKCNLRVCDSWIEHSEARQIVLKESVEQKMGTSFTS